MTRESCTVCKKQGTDATRLKRCAKCKTEWYCSRDCQKAGWKNHKKTCAKNASDAGTPSGDASQTSANTAAQPKNLSAAIDKPFHQLESKTWLHDRPREDVYQLLIDAYRLRMEDNYKLEGDCDEDSIYGGRADSTAGFRRFLRLAEKTRWVLPSWWDSAKATECENSGMRGGWTSLASVVDKSDIVEHYGDPRMPMQLRVLGEQIYGRGPGGQSSAAMIQTMKSVEKGDMASSFFSLA